MGTPGLGIILTKELSLAHWKDSDYVGVEVHDDGKIIIKKVNY